MSENGLRALVVDDDPAIRRMVSKVLEREGFIADTAVDGSEALACIRTNGYQLVVLDLMMPKVDGFEVIQELRDHCKETLQKVIVTSAVAADVQERLGCVCHVLPKPFDIAKLAEYARECARG